MTTDPADLTSKRLMLSLDEIEGTDLPLVGGKAFRLALLKQHGLNVPSGLVLTTHFFESQVHHAQFAPLWAGSPDVAVTTESLAWLADSLKTRALARPLLAAFQAGLSACFGPDITSFAVRSSAIDEDQRDHTFAGIHLTELGVPRSALEIAITRCWASALSKPAIEYRQAHGMSIQAIRVAVLLQPMLQPASSGVGFTVNPLTGGRDEFIIETTWGLGEAVVSGEVQPYFYKLANRPPDYPLLDKRPGNVTPPPDQAGRAETGPLTPPELAELAIKMEQVQAFMGEPQDIEWACQAGTFYILQTRPVALAAPATTAVDQEWTRGSHPEFLPELPSPFFGSLLERTQVRAMTFFEELGLKLHGLGPYVRLILGRPYLNLTLLKRVIAQVGINPGSMLHTIGHTEPGAGGGSLSLDWETAWQARRIYRRVLGSFRRNRRSLKQYQALAEEVRQLLAEPDLDAPPPGLLAQFRQHERIYSDLFEVNLALESAISAVTALGSSLIAPLAQSPATVISALALKTVRSGDRQLTQALQELAGMARQDSRVRAYLAEMAADGDNYQQALAGTPFLAGFTSLLAEHGHRAIYETDTGWPRYGEDPGPLLRIIQQYVQSDPGPHQARSEPTWSTLTRPGQGIDRALPWRRWLAALFINTLSRLLAMRDQLHAARAVAMAACRRWDLALGQRWAEKGWLEKPEDIFWLTLEEVERTLMVEGDTGLMLTSTVRARRETYRTYAETTMPFTLSESEISSIQVGLGPSPGPLSDVLVGLPISPGQARGTVLVLHSPDQFQKLAGDIILVTPSTDPAWLPLLHLASGLIVEMGGLLSHGSVIAREYGLPAVANIPNATRRFRTGDSVLVDGSTGVIQVLEAAAEEA